MFEKSRIHQSVPTFITMGVVVSSLIFSIPAKSADLTEIPPKKQTISQLYLTATAAAEMGKSDRVLFVDIRSRAEVAFLGLPTIADVNIPYRELTEFPEYDEVKNAYKLIENVDFVPMIEAALEAHGLSKSSPIILMCRSGSRSAKAANKLARIGYGQVYSVIDGYEGDVAKKGPEKGRRSVNGWKNAGLPWSYKIKPSQLYPGDKS